MKKLLRNSLNRLGFDLVRTKNLHDNLTKHLSNVLLSRNIDCVFDVGANSGQYGLFLRDLGYKGHIISFEPASSVFKLLKKNSENDDKWHCYDYALGDKNEEKTLNVYKSTVFSSFLTANNYSKSIWHSLEDVTPETVKVFRLEDVWDDLTGKLGCSNYMLKLDTQGFDKFVFDGAHNCLKNISVLQSELSLIPVYDGMIQVYDILQQFHSLNFFISGMYPINRDKSLAVIEYDCVMVKKIPE
jgi:FkbM family methyltransferase